MAYVEDKPADKTPAPPVAAKKDTAAPPAAKPAEEKKPAEGSKPAADAKTETKPVAKADAKAGDKLVGDKKPADAKTPAAGKQPETKPAADAGKSTAGTKVETPKPAKTAEQKLRDVVRRDLAGKAFRENATKIETTLENYRNEYTHYLEEQAANPKAVMPTPPDFAALAKEYEMTAGRTTGLVSKRVLKESDFGKSVQVNMETRQLMEVADQIFGPTTLYKVDRSFKDVEYIFWKTDDQPERVPKWEDEGTRKEVLRAWKLVEGRKLAQAAAEKLKTVASGKPGTSLTELVAVKKQVSTPPPFTWLTSMLSEAPKISEVGDLDRLGPKFMQAVFGLNPNQAGPLPQTCPNRKSTWSA